MLNKDQLIEDFNQKVHNLFEVDIGDFKRKVLSYLNYFEEEWQEYFNLNDFKIELNQIRSTIVCNNTIEIDLLRQQVIEQFNQINFKTE